MSTQPGFEKLPVPSKDQLRPNARDARPERHLLLHVRECGTTVELRRGVGAISRARLTRQRENEPYARRTTHDAPCHRI